MPRDLIRDTDSYKLTHYRQYPPDTAHVYSYWESRGGFLDWTVFFGLQYYLREYLSHPITQDDIDYNAELAAAHFGNMDLFNKAGWQHILDEHGGFLPLRIMAVKEGTVVPTGNVMMTIENTDPKVPWLTNWMETPLCRLWYPTTVASLSRQLRLRIGAALEKSGDLEGLPFKLHDFGSRGVSSRETAAIGGAAHLVNFMGTDTFVALDLLRQHYGTSMAGFSIPAAEHSTITSWGRKHEEDAFRNMIQQFGTDAPGMYAVVSDSYDIYAACEMWGTKLKAEVLEAGNMLVVRPDSGDPIDTTLKCLEILGTHFGSTKNEKGYKVLNGVRIIYGDGMNLESVTRLMFEAMAEKWSIDNLAFGMGGALLQKVNRDDFNFAFKCSQITLADGSTRDVYKDPIAQSMKRSKRGRLALIQSGHHGLRTVPEDNGTGSDNLLEPVYEDGKVLRTQTLDEIRELARDLQGAPA